MVRFTMLISLILVLTACKSTGRVESIEVVDAVAQKAVAIYEEEMKSQGYDATITITYDENHSGVITPEYFWYIVEADITNFEGFGYDEKFEALKFLSSVDTCENIMKLREELVVAVLLFQEQISNGEDVYEASFGKIGDKYEITGINKNGETYSKPVELSKFDKYIKENNVKLTAGDVQYDITNNVGKYFTLIGTAELSDYYNYGYDSKMESNYFCLRITPKSEKSSDSWYIYCHRNSFKGLFDKAKDGKISVQTICFIDKDRFKSGQGNLATIKAAVY